MTFQELKLLVDLVGKYLECLEENDGLQECIDVAEEFFGILDIDWEHCEELELSDTDDIAPAVKAI